MQVPSEHLSFCNKKILLQNSGVFLTPKTCLQKGFEFHKRNIHKEKSGTVTEGKIKNKINNYDIQQPYLLRRRNDRSY